MTMMMMMIKLKNIQLLMKNLFLRHVVLTVPSQIQNRKLIIPMNL
jgi:hypothetical protein